MVRSSEDTVHWLRRESVKEVSRERGSAGVLERELVVKESPARLQRQRKQAEEKTGIKAS
jgi:hypothetical protein